LTLKPVAGHRAQVELYFQGLTARASGVNHANGIIPAAADAFKKIFIHDPLQSRSMAQKAKL
jgi:hypothetical protein